MSATPPAPPSGPLSGIKVLDFGHTIMGPCAGLLLADLGADVVKVEPTDACRGSPPGSLPPTIAINAALPST